jgi:3-hydroxyisobutyrate dehydrogenase-like beta-hydroxyacid dehydrogenase
MKIGFLGLGTMGQPMAVRLARAGHEVLGWNRTRARLEGLGQGTLVPVTTPGEACQADLLISMVSDDEALRAILYQDGRLVSAGVPGLVHVCMATVSDGLALELAEAHARLDQAYVSAPVFGAPEAAKAGRLVIPVSGPEPAYHRIRPVLEVLGRPDYLGEDPAAAPVVKAAGSFLMAAVVESLRDATTLVHAAGVDPREFTGIITQALFPTPVYQYLGGMLANREALQGVRVPNPFLKAARQCAASAVRLGIAVPTIDHVRDCGD